MTFAWQRLLAVLLAWAWLTAAAAGPGIIQLDAGGHRLTAELAVTPSERERGLMQREALPDDHGMLFVFDAPGRICMWMKDTPLPLSVAFLDSSGVIVDIADMQPLSLDVHCAGRPARYALEMTRGWFAGRGISSGMRIRGLERLPRVP